MISTKLILSSITVSLCLIVRLPATAQDSANLPGRAATLLSTRCIKCHGPEKKSGGVDLSTRAIAISTGALADSGTSGSAAVAAVSAGKMPPDGKLSAAEVKLLRDWVASGAVYSKDQLVAIKPPNKTPWSMTPISHPVVPKTAFDKLSSNPIDRFLFARLQRSGLTPSAPASRPELLRRVSIDLTGLPPTPEAIAAFCADKSPNAYEKVVDRLLASSAYGERWGRHWLDVVRYGESHGYEQNHLRPNAWPYRDYVIRSMNQDKPYDRFVKEQIAGDIIGKGDPSVEVATGFLVSGIHDTVPILTDEGTRQQRANDLDDIVSTTGITFLGVSLNCARCHDHKFDPIPTRDYYRMTAIFSGVYHGDRQLSQRPNSPEDQRKVDDARARQTTLRAARADLLATAKTQLVAANKGLREPVSSVFNEDRFATTNAKYLRFVITATSNGAEPCIDELEIYGPANASQNLALASRGAKATASSLLPGYTEHQINHLNDGKHGNSFSWISNERGAGWAQIELPQAEQISRVVWSRDSEKRLSDRVATAYHIDISKDGLSWVRVASSDDRSVDPKAYSEERLKQALNPDQHKKLEALDADLQIADNTLQSLAPVMSAYCGKFDDPAPIYILPRGDVMHRGDLVTPGALSQIPGLAGDLKTAANSTTAAVKLASLTDVSPESVDPRLQLADWICDSRNPLTSRVIVNRIWERHFGHGIVDTPSDFGNMGAPASHPELLDWLATDVMTHGWRLKRLHRMIATSYAYQQTSTVNSAGMAKDGDNRLIWHMPLRRMEAEAVRDSILTVSGKLNLKAAGGPGFRLFKYSVLNVAIYETREDQGPDTWRRSVYQIPARGIRDELLGVLDCPDSSERAAHRTSTTTALQALSMMNGLFMNQQATYFAERVRGIAGDNSAKQVSAAFQLAFGRSPSAKEVAAARALIAIEGLPTLCRALYNANEFVYY